MAYVLPEDLQQAKRMDLLTYLQTFEPQELVRVSGNTYCTREHDSLKISNGMWHWFSRKIGGKSALDYLILVRGLTLPQAVEQILGRAAAVRLCNTIYDRAKEVEEHLRMLTEEQQLEQIEQENQRKEENRDEQFRGSSGSGDPNVPEWG